MNGSVTGSPFGARGCHDVDETREDFGGVGAVYVGVPSHDDRAELQLRQLRGVTAGADLDLAADRIAVRIVALGEYPRRGACAPPDHATMKPPSARPSTPAIPGSRSSRVGLQRRAHRGSVRVEPPHENVVPAPRYECLPRDNEAAVCKRRYDRMRLAARGRRVDGKFKPDRRAVIVVDPHLDGGGGHARVPSVRIAT